jgi:hypothetical protein
MKRRCAASVRAHFATWTTSRMASLRFPRLAFGCVAAVLSRSPALAQSSADDCSAVKTTMAPVELSYHVPNHAKVTLQSHRDKSGDYVTWNRTEDGTLVSVIKFTFVQGIGTETRETSTRHGKLKAITRKFSVEGLPRNFDRRSNVQYRSTVVSTYADGSTDETTSMVSYKFKSEETMAIGSCVLDIIRGESIASLGMTGRTSRSSLLFFPELKLTVGTSGHDPIIDHVKTTFTPITLLQ